MCMSKYLRHPSVHITYQLTQYYLVYERHLPHELLLHALDLLNERSLRLQSMALRLLR
jgi:hypothetical protein